MAYYRINGGKRLEGAVTISGAKNAALAIIPAVILSGESCLLENLPEIEDVRIVEEILTSMGADISRTPDGSMRIDPSGISTFSVTGEMVSSMRASYYLLGALLGRYKKAEIALPGGCAIGQRPIDQHIKGFESLGCATDCAEGEVRIDAKKLRGGHVFFDVVSVGATINVMLAAVLAPGKTIMENVAKEPHVVDLANFLNSMGANIKGAGTDVIKIEGVERLIGGTYSIIPDQIEAGTYMSAIIATRGDAIVKNVIPKHLDAITAKFIEMGATVEEFDDSVRVAAESPLRQINVKTLPYPGFPTDLQPQIVALLSTVDGQSVVSEGVWDSRFQYVSELEKLGADIMVEGKRAIINGGSPLIGANVAATDLRAGASMIIAALAAEGSTVISELRHIDRGYEHIVDKLKALGADIERTDD